MNRLLAAVVMAPIVSATACAGQTPSSGLGTTTATASATARASPASQTSPSALSSPTATPAASAPAIPRCPDLASLGITSMLLQFTGPERSDAALCQVDDLAHPRLLAPVTSGLFLTADLIGYLELTGGGTTSPPEQVTSIFRILDVTNGTTRDVATAQGIAQTVAWSADQSMVAYSIDTAGYFRRFWLKHLGAPATALGPPMQVLGRGPSGEDQLLVVFSPDGQYVLFVDTVVNRLQVFRSSDGAAVYSPPSGSVDDPWTMATWSHQTDGLYFRNHSAVFRWDPTSGAVSFAPGLPWLDPTLSADDRTVAYALVNADRVPHVEIRDLTTQAIVSSVPWRATPVFLSKTMVLLDIQTACINGECPGYAWNGKYAVFHLDTHSETEFGLSGWWMSTFWPHS